MAGMMLTSALNSIQAKEAVPETTDAKQDKVEVTQDSPLRQAFEKGKTLFYDINKKVLSTSYLFT